VDEVTVESVSGIVAASAAAYPQKPALVFRNRPIPYAELDEWVHRSSASLQSLGIRKGDRVALLVGNVPEFLYVFYGTVSLGGVAVPLHPTLTPEELGYILADCEARVVAAQIDLLPLVLAVRDRVPSIEHVLVVGPAPTPRGTRSLDELLDRSVGDRPVVDREEGDVAVLSYTTGTTSDPRGVMLTRGNLLASLRQISAIPALKQERTDIVLLVLPLSSLFALNVILGSALNEGATVVLVERFDPEETLDLIDELGVTALFGTPAMFRSWLQAAEARDAELSSVRLAVSVLPHLPADILEAFRRRLGVTIWEAYGLPEAPVVSTTALAATPKMNSVGLPLHDVDVRLVDEHGEDVEDGDPGEIVVRGPNVSQGYWKAPEESEGVRMPGWFRTGDLAYRDEEGRLFLVGRMKDVIRVSGFNVFPREVEEVLSRHPKVAACTVSGVPDERSGEGVRALVTLEAGQSATEGEIVAYCETYLARFKCPTIVEFVQAP
jgi:long-chain acyl-CoA synthetase